MRTETIYNGIDVERFSSVSHSSFRQEFSIPDHKKTIGIIATFTEKKRHTLFIEIAARVKQQCAEACFVIVGSDIWNTRVRKEALYAQAKRHNIHNDVIFTGWRDDIPQILAGLDALILPSTSEPFPLVVLEAMASRTIVFAHEGSGGPQEAVHNNEEGFLVDCEDVDACARTIVDVLRDEKRCQRVRQRAYERVRDDFTTEIFIRHVERLYNEVIRS